MTSIERFLKKEVMCRETISWWLELIVKIGILIVGFLQASSLSFGKPIISLFLWPTVVLGGIVLLFRLINWKNYYHSANFCLLVFFSFSYLISSAVNIKYGWYDNFRTLIWCIFLFFIVYCYDESENMHSVNKQNRILIEIYLLGNAVLSILSFYFLFIGYSKVFYPEQAQGGPIYYIGFQWGRLYGAYWDANIGALMCVVAIILSLICFRKEKKVVGRVLYISNIILETLYVTFSDSRMGKLCLFVGIGVFTFSTLIKGKKIIKTTILTLIICAITIMLPTMIKTGYNGWISISESQLNGEEKEEVELGREEEYEGDITNRRLDIWKSAIEIFTREPLIGVGHNNVLAYVHDKLPESYLINNDHMEFSSMHNEFMDILVGQGLLGEVLYLILAIRFCILILKKWKVIISDTTWKIQGCFAIIAVMVTATGVITEIIYVTSPMSMVFWMVLGYLVRINERICDN